MLSIVNMNYLNQHSWAPPVWQGLLIQVGRAAKVLSGSIYYAPGELPNLLLR